MFSSFTLQSRRFRCVALVGLVWAMVAGGAAADRTLLNVSYDVTREFYQEFNKEFASEWKRRTGEAVRISMSHGGSSKQARSVIDGLEADVVTMNQALDIHILNERGNLIPAIWADRLPFRSAPYTSTVLFLVRKGNPKKIRDWDDLVRSGVSVIIPNPKTSGNGRYSYLAALGYARQLPGATDSSAREFVRKLFGNVPVLDAGGRGATTTFAQRGIGDVLLTFESEVHLVKREFGEDRFDLVVPSVSVEAENPVVWVDAVVARRGTTELAKAYLEFLFGPTGQEVAARHHFRPRDAGVRARYAGRFPALRLLTVDEIAGGWKSALEKHFSDGAGFDQIYEKGR